MLHRLSTAAVIIVVGTLTLVSGQEPSLSWPYKIERVPSPAGRDSGQPQLSSSARGLVLSWIERKDQRATLRFALRTGQGWSAPRDVASGTDWFVNWADVPSVVRLASGELVAHWLQKSGPSTYAYDVRLSYSNDEGKTWSPSFTPHSDGTQTEHGFASLFQMPGAGLGLAWLDGRAMKAGGSHDAHGTSAGAMSVRLATFGRDWKQTSEVPIDLRVCECCPTTAALTSDGPIVAYRDRTDEEVRDIFISRLENGRWTEPRAVHADDWKIAACPVNGPMLSARGRDVAIAWFTAQGDQPRALVAFSRDAGRTFGAPIRLDAAGSLGRVDVELMSDGSAIASWIEFADQQAQFRVRRVEPSGTTSPAIVVSGLTGSRASGYPRIASNGGEMVFAWTEITAGRSQVQTAVASLAGRMPTASAVDTSRKSVAPRGGGANQRVQTAKIVVSERGFDPATLTLRAGVPAHLTFIRTTDKTCGEEVVFPSLKIRKDLPVNEPVIIELPPTKTGRKIAFACGMDMFRGTIVVQ